MEVDEDSVDVMVRKLLTEVKGRHISSADDSFKKDIVKMVLGPDVHMQNEKKLEKRTVELLKGLRYVQPGELQAIHQKLSVWHLEVQKTVTISHPKPSTQPEPVAGPSHDHTTTGDVQKPVTDVDPSSPSISHPKPSTQREPLADPSHDHTTTGHVQPDVELDAEQELFEIDSGDIAGTAKRMEPVPPNEMQDLLDWMLSRDICNLSRELSPQYKDNWATFLRDVLPESKLMGCQAAESPQIRVLQKMMRDLTELSKYLSPRRRKMWVHDFEVRWEVALRVSYLCRVGKSTLLGDETFWHLEVLLAIKTLDELEASLTEKRAEQQVHHISVY